MSRPVLVVEDSPTQRAALQRLFAELGSFHVAAGPQTADQAGRWLDANPEGWSLAVVDLILEQGTGMSVIARCRQRPAGSKVVVLSSYATPRVREHCLKLGADAVFQKASEFGAFASYLRTL
jgi:CheY-like chemotaxis protein